MATKKTSVHTMIATIPRFTEQDRYKVWSMDVLDTGRLAVAGHSHENTFIDLFMFNSDPDSQENPLLLRPEHYFSEKYTEFGSSRRSVCFLDDCRFLTCCNNTIKLYDSSSNGGLVKQGEFKREALCMTTRDGLVYVGLESDKVNEVIVLSEEGREGEREFITSKTITLKGLEGSPYDLTVSSNNKLFICTRYSGRAYICNSEGEIEQPYENTLEYSYAWSITVSEEKGLIFILWCCGVRSQVVVYALPGDHSSIFGGHSSISGVHILASFKVPDNSRRIRINNNINRLFLVTATGKVYEYHTSDIFTFDNLLIHSKSLIEKDDCQKLLDYLKVPAKESNDIMRSDAPFTTLIHHLREAGTVSVDAFSRLMTACSDKGLSKLVAALTVYQQAQVTQNVFKDQLKALENKRQELSDKLAESENEKQQLRDELKTLKEEKAALLQQQQQASSASVTEGETLPEELETLDVSQHSTLAD